MLWRLADLEHRVDDPALKGLLDRPRVRAIVAAIADHSSYLWHLIDADPARFHRILENDPWAHLDAVLSDLCAGPALAEG